MYEIEMKVAVRDAERIREKLSGLGFLPVQTIREEDYYYDTASSRIKNGGEALRVRKITDLADGTVRSVITYKGRKLDAVSKSRRELETGVSDGTTAMAIFEAVGFQRVSPPVTKTRQELSLGSMHACIDRIEALGDFLELEVIVDGTDEKDAALAGITEVLGHLGYSPADSIRNSYLSMLQGAEEGEDNGIIENG